MKSTARSKKKNEHPEHPNVSRISRSAGNIVSTNNNRNNRINRNYSNYANYANNLNMAGGIGVLDIPKSTRTRSADLDRYRDRARESKKFPNRRRKIITGKDLTTPLRRAKVKEKRINLKVITVNKQKKKFPVGVIASVFAVTAALLCLICSYIVLNDYSVNVNEMKRNITAEEKRERELESMLERKNDLNAFIEIATTKLGMVKEDLLQKNYIPVKSKDKAEVVEEQDSIIFKIPSILSAIFSTK